MVAGGVEVGLGVGVGDGFGVEVDVFDRVGLGCVGVGAGVRVAVGVLVGEYVLRVVDGAVEDGEVAPLDVFEVVALRAVGATRLRLVARGRFPPGWLRAEVADWLGEVASPAPAGGGAPRPAPPAASGVVWTPASG